MNNGKLCRMLFVLICLCISTGAYADSKPLWVKKGISELNKQRLNDTYSFKLFHTVDADKRVIELSRFRALQEYVDSAYNVSVADMRLDSIPGNNGRTTYTVSFDKNGQRQTVYAQLVDQYTRLEEFVTNKFEYNYYQLFAISNPGVTVPEFDDFTLTTNFNRGQAVARSLIPGLGQIYKGQKVKGYIFMGTEALLIAGIIYSNDRYHHYKDLYNKTGDRNYHNNKTTFRELLTFCSIAAGGLYIYNLFDAALCHIPRRVEISQAGRPNASLSWSPVILPDASGKGLGFGVGLDFNF